tara:strand:- start:144 stop:2252 length:2109 start_codon:yes stop_codon:yes gene_type:complete
VAVSNVELRVSATQAITALRKVDTQAKKFNQTVNGTGSKLKDANLGLRVLPKGFFAAGKGASAASLSFKAAAASLGTLLAPITAGITLIAAFGKVFSTLAAQDFASAKIKTLGVEADALTPKLATLSNQLSGQVSQLGLLEASYDVASAGFGETAELIDVLKASQLGATGGFSDLATVTDATTSVLNAYGLESDKAAKIVDGFVQTQNDGKIVVQQYAQQIGRLAPIAAGAGVGIEELNAAISSVTATGVPVESTFAGLRQVIAAIQKPTGEAAKAAEKLGIDFSAAALSSKGLGGVLQEIIDKGGASEETLALLFGSVEARTAVLPLLNDQLVSFNKNLENQAEAQGTAAQAAFTSSNTIQGQLTRLGTAFTNLAGEGSEFGIVIRETLKVAAVTIEALAAAVKIVFLPVRTLAALVQEVGLAISEAIGVDAQNVLFDLEQGWIAVKEGVTAFSNAVIEVGRTVGTVIGGIVKKFIGAFQAIGKFIDENPVAQFILKFSGIELIQTNINRLTESFGQKVEENAEKTDKLKKKIAETKNETGKLNDSFAKIGDTLATGVSDALVGVIQGTKSLADAARSVLNTIVNQFLTLGINTLLFSAFGGSTGLFKNLPTFAAGGRPPVGRPSIVGERGPELFVPSTAGTIIPNDKMGGMTNNIVVNVAVDGGVGVEADESSSKQFGLALAAAIQSEIINQKRAGGLLA